MEQEATWNRYIIHIDMDAFYASVEQRDNPQLRGLPVVVGGDPFGRGVVTSASYEARKFGIHSAMPSSQARKLCPGAIFLYPRFDSYREASRNIMAIFHDVSDLVEPMSLDEAYIDISERVIEGEDPESITRDVIDRIRTEIRLPASAGLSFNKFLAKVGSGFNKPKGIKVISPKDAPSFLDELPIRKFYGVGEATERRMVDRGINTGADLKLFTKEELVSWFGRAGVYYYDIVHCLYDSPVKNHHERRSIGKERTLHEDTDSIAEMLEKLASIAEMLESSMEKRDLLGRTLALRLKYSDRSRISRAVTLPLPTRDQNIMMEKVKDLLSKTEAGERSVRLLGISISNLDRVRKGRNMGNQTTLDRFFMIPIDDPLSTKTISFDHNFISS